MKKILILITIILATAMVANLAVSSISNDFGILTEKASPSDTVSPNQIQVYKDKVVLDIQNAEWTEYTDSNSMDPVLDSEANGIVVVPKSDTELKIGDIVSYQPISDENLVVHRITGTGTDELGKFYVMKGDNNSSADPEKVRFDQIKYKTIGIIY